MVRWQVEVVGETTTGVDDRLTGGLGLGTGGDGGGEIRAGRDLGGTDSRDIGAARRERRAEAVTVIETVITITSNTYFYF